MQAMGVQRGDGNDVFNPVDCGVQIDADTAPADIPPPAACAATFTALNPVRSSGEAKPGSPPDTVQDGDMPALLAFLDQEVAAAESRALLDGIEGRGTAPFVAEPDALQASRPFARGNNFGQDYGGISEPGGALTFVIAWTSVEDAAGGVLARAEGMNAELLHDSSFSTLSGFDNTDVYRLIYKTLFNVKLGRGIGLSAQDRLRAIQVD